MPQTCCSIGCTNRKVKGSKKGFLESLLRLIEDSNGLPPLTERIGPPQSIPEYTVITLLLVSLLTYNKGYLIHVLLAEQPSEDSRHPDYRIA